jgi:hypothetical protein
MRRITAVAGAVLIAGALSACSVSASIGAGQPSSSPSCASSACAASEIQRSLLGLEAKDGAAITKAACKAARENPGGTWTATCTVTESDGGVYDGKGNWFPAKAQVSFEPIAVMKAPTES